MDGLAIAASLIEVRRAAEGALIRAIHEPEPGTFLVRVFGIGERTVLLSPRAACLHVTQLSFRNPERPSSFVMQLRKHLRGARITHIRQEGLERAVEIVAVRSDSGTRAVSSLVVELTGLRGNLLLLDERSVVRGSLREDPRNPVGCVYTPLQAQPKSDPRTVTTDALAQFLALDVPARALAHSLEGVGRQTALDVVALAAAAGGSDPVHIRAALEEIVSCVGQPQPHVSSALSVVTFYPPPVPALPSASLGEAFDTVARGPTTVGPVAVDRPTRDRILHAIGRATRTARALRQWLDASHDAAELRRRADFLMLHAGEIGRGTKAVAGSDPTTGEPVSFALVSRMNGMENAQALYRKARKLDRGRPTVAARLQRIEQEKSQLETMLRDFDEGRNIDEVTLNGKRAALAHKPAPPASGPRRFEVEGHTVLVGRSARQNDDLVHHARPHDLWLHARDVAGSHVIVRRDGQAEIPGRVIEEAARLAARYSKADRRGKVAVVCTEARHVRKPRHGAPGLAIITNESTLTVELTEPT